MTSWLIFEESIDRRAIHLSLDTHVLEQAMCSFSKVYWHSDKFVDRLIPDYALSLSLSLSLLSLSFSLFLFLFLIHMKTQGRMRKQAHTCGGVGAETDAKLQMGFLLDCRRL